MAVLFFCFFVELTTIMSGYCRAAGFSMAVSQRITVNFSALHSFVMTFRDFQNIHSLKITGNCSLI